MKQISPDLLNKCKEVTSIMKQAHEAIQQIMFDIEAGRAKPHNNITRGGPNSSQSALVDPNLASIHEYNNSIILSTPQNGAQNGNLNLLTDEDLNNNNRNNHSPKDTSNKPRPKHKNNNNSNSSSRDKNSPRTNSDFSSPKPRPVSPNKNKKRKSKNGIKLKNESSGLNHSTFLDAELPENAIVMSGAPVDSDEEKGGSNL